jgi:hypothetical protein
MQSEGSLSCSVKPATDPYPEPDWSSFHPRFVHYDVSLSSRLQIGLSNGLFLLHGVTFHKIALAN